MTVKTWFLNKNFDASERIAISTTEPTIERETEKAMLLKWNSEFGIIKSWVPKSCIIAAPAVKAEVEDITGKKVVTKNGLELKVVEDKGATVVLENGKEYARFTLKF